MMASSPPAPPTVAQILVRMNARVSGIRTYQVPIVIDARLRKVVTIPVWLTGTEYFAAPDRYSLHMDTVPAIAKSFKNLIASLGSPVTWPQTYAITQVPASVTVTRPAYELLGVPRHPGNVDHVLLDVDASTYAPVEVRWFYRNGATIAMTVNEQVADGKYPLPSSETLNVAFPEYRGTAVIHYGRYSVNQPLPQDAFDTQKR